MTVFAEQVAVELAVTLSVGAIFGFVSGLLSVPGQAEEQDRERACRRCGSVGTIGAWPNGGSVGYR